MDCYSSRAASQNFMKELAQSDLLFSSYSSGCITTPKIKKTQKFYFNAGYGQIKWPQKVKIVPENL